MDGYGIYGGTAGKGLCPGSGAYGRSRQKRKCRKHRTTDLAHRIVGNGELEKYHDVTWRKHSLFLKFQTASGKMKDELVDSTYLRLKACATSVEQYFTWDIREDILERMISVISL